MLVSFTCNWRPLVCHCQSVTVTNLRGALFLQRSAPKAGKQLLSLFRRPCNTQCCCQGRDSRTRTWCPRTRTRTRTWKLVLKDKDFHRRQQHCGEAVRWDWHELEPDQGIMANQATHSSLSHCKKMVLDISHATLAYSILEKYRGLEPPRTRTRTRTCSSRTSWTRTRTWILEDKDFPRGQQHW